MAKYTEASCRLCRREGEKLFLKGDKCYSDKCVFLSRPNVPGQHGAQKKKQTEYATQLREKQKVRRIYGILEKQFREYYDKADRMRGVTGENMLILIERRLDNVVYRLGLGSSRAMSRQLVNHGHITVNGKVVDIPSYLVKVGDVIAVKESKASKDMYKDIKEGKTLNIVKWLEFDNATLTGKVVAMPLREDIDSAISEHLIVELYSK